MLVAGGEGGGDQVCIVPLHKRGSFLIFPIFPLFVSYILPYTQYPSPIPILIIPLAIIILIIFITLTILLLQRGLFTLILMIGSGEQCETSHKCHH